MTQKFLYMEDLKVGQKFKAGPTPPLTEAEIIAYARRFDPQAFHTDPEKAKDLLFGGLIASGWHTASLTMRMIIEATPPIEGGMIGRGVEKMSWPRPVRAGDKLSLEMEVLEIRPSASNPKRSSVRTKNTTLNQNGEVVQEMETVIFVPRKTA